MTLKNLYKSPAYDIIECADRDEWLEARKDGIGSSEVGAIMGESTFATRLSVWNRHMGIVPPVPETLIMEMGHYLEPLVAKQFSRETGAWIDPDTAPDFIAVAKDKPYFRVSPDRFFHPLGVDPWDRCDATALVLECKSTDKPVSETDYPRYWWWQCQYQMRVTGKDRCALAWLIRSTGRFGYTWVYFDPQSWTQAEKVLDEFWNVNILQNVRPNVAQSMEDVKELWPRAIDGTAVASPDIIDLLGEYSSLSATTKQAEKTLEQIKVRILGCMQGREGLVDADGRLLATYRSNSKGGRTFSCKI